MIFKVDFAKAYDSIRWDYLDDVLISFGFGTKWRSWIRGSCEEGMFKGYKIDPSTTWSHLCFAVDAVFMGWESLVSSLSIGALLFKWYGATFHDNSLWSRNYISLHGLNDHVYSCCFSIRHGAPSNRTFGKIFGLAINLLPAFLFRVFALEENNDISVADKMNTVYLLFFSTSCPRRGTSNNNLISFSIITVTVIYLILDDRVLELKWRWCFSSSRCSFYVLDEAFLPKMEVPTRWIKSIRFGKMFVLLKLYLDRLHTRSNLSFVGSLLPSLACLFVIT
ncbi:hypothetical protein Tco_1271239 [Tanacetum coccineum]